jgi:hypothetical protein
MNKHFRVAHLEEFVTGGAGMPSRLVVHKGLKSFTGIASFTQLGSPLLTLDVDSVW